MATNVIASQVHNQFQLNIDNTKCSNNVSNIRASLVRSVVVVLNESEEVLKIDKEEVASATSAGGANKGQNFMINQPMISPTEIIEKHAFNTNDGSTRYGSVLTPTYSGPMIKVSYGYEVRVYHKAMVGSDNVTVIEIPVTVSCLTPSFYQHTKHLGGSIASAPGSQINQPIMKQPPRSMSYGAG